MPIDPARLARIRARILAAATLAVPACGSPQETINVRYQDPPNVNEPPADPKPVDGPVNEPIVDRPPASPELDEPHINTPPPEPKHINTPPPQTKLAPPPGDMDVNRPNPDATPPKPQPTNKPKIHVNTPEPR